MNLNNNYKFIYNYYINMSQDLCNNPKNRGNEICDLLRSLGKNRDKITRDIRSIYADLDYITRDNKAVAKNLQKTLDTTIVTGGGKKVKLEKGFKKFIKQMRNYFDKDKSWKNEFKEEMLEQDILNIYDFQQKIEYDNEYALDLASDYEFNLETLKEIIDIPKYGKLVIERDNLIRTLEYLIKKFNLKIKDDIYQFTNSRLYRKLAILMNTYKDKIPDKKLDSILKLFELPSEGEYLSEQLLFIYQSKLESNMKKLLRKCEFLNKKRIEDKGRILDEINENSIKAFNKKVAKVLKSSRGSKT